jgi:RHS repeat-associated protein
MPDGTTYAMSMAYDSHGQLTSRTAPSGGHSLNLAYDMWTGLLDTLQALGTQMAVARDGDLAPVNLTYRLIGGQSSWYRSFKYDADHHDMSDTFSPTALETDFGTSWVYDSLGRVTAATQGSNATYRFAYDPAGQLATACKNGAYWYCIDEYGNNVNSGDGQWDSLVASYHYDAAGNRGTTIAAGNRVTQFGNYAITYNTNGQVTQELWAGVDTLQLRWNALGQLRWAHRDSAGVVVATDSMVYDALGHRVAKIVNGVTTWFVYDGDQVVLDVTGASPHTVLKEYAYLPGGDLYGLDVPGQTPLIALASPVSRTMLGMATADSGKMVKRDFDVLVTAWGQQTADTGLVVRFRMGGQEYDQEIGLYHLGARYYDPELGRFLSEDPAGVAASLNLYEYAGNEPINSRDPTGLDTDDPPLGYVPDNEQPWYGSGLDDIGGDGLPSWMEELDAEAARDDATWAAIEAAKAQAAKHAGPKKICKVNAHGVYNDLPTRAPNQQGAYGVPETPGTAAIDRSQWLPAGSSN